MERWLGFRVISVPFLGGFAVKKTAEICVATHLRHPRAIHCGEKYINRGVRQECAEKMR